MEDGLEKWDEVSCTDSSAEGEMVRVRKREQRMARKTGRSLGTLDYTITN